MKSFEIRKQFLEFFKEKGHRIVPSAPVIPFDDPTLLFTNAGMNQFKDVFLGTGTRKYTRAADTQKCIRVSGKHNDLEEVGHDTYHHTFFEMLGNWSFGDYYKTEAITWAWQLLTDIWKLPKERLWATVFRTDNEAYEIWKDKTDIDPAHILYFDEKDNFWEMGETGPCGPCSEIHINVGNDFNNPKYVNAGTAECIEIWNLVFIQHNRDLQGVLHDLPMKHIDTGMGFERICAVLQNKKSNYDTDVFMPLIESIAGMSGIAYEKERDKIPMRVIADHVRMLSFAIADGAYPGNEGRGYVLRRILRRAARYGRKLGLDKPFIHQLVKVLVENMEDVFPELKHKQEHIEKIIKAEEESFNVTLDRGIELFEKIVQKVDARDEKIISGEDLFLLYDTYGFPVDLVNVMAQERKLTVDEVKFNELMDEQKSRGRESSRDKFSMGNINLSNLDSFDLMENTRTEFVGYDKDKYRVEAKITEFKKEGDKSFIILDKTPFYVESGGQIDDLGTIDLSGVKLNVIDVVKINDSVIHIVENPEDIKLAVGMDVFAEIDEKRRWDIMRNHSATHLMHAALRKILGTHVQQAGSYVGPDRLRFDFSHFARLSDSDIERVELMVNDEILSNIELTHHRSISFDEAKKMNALMFFGDKYGDKVNVVQFNNVSKEFCGGTHVSNTSQIGLFKIISEASVASGVRRIEAVTGRGVEKYIKEKEEQIKKDEQRISELIDEKRKLEKEISGLSFQSKLDVISEIASDPMDIRGVKIYKGKVDALDMDELKLFGDELRLKMRNGGVGVLISGLDGKVGIVCVVSDDLIKDKKISAGKIVGDVAKIVGGGGGGKPHLATAGGKDITKIDAALHNVEEIVSKYFE